MRCRQPASKGIRGRPSRDGHNLGRGDIIVLFFFIVRAINGGGVALCFFPQRVTKNQRDQMQQVLKIAPLFQFPNLKAKQNKRGFRRK